MPYVRFWISNEQRDTLLQLGRREEQESARLLNHKPRRLSVSGVAAACFEEGYLDMQVRQPIEDDD